MSAVSIIEGNLAYGSGSNVSATLSACVPGSVIVAVVTAETGITGVFDNVNSGGYNAPTGQFGVCHAFYINNTATGSVTVSAFLSSNAASSISVFQINGENGTPLLDSYSVNPYQATPVNNGNLSITTNTANCAAFAGAIAYPDTYVVNPQSGWTNYVTQHAGVGHYQDSQYIADLGAAGAHTVWAGQGMDSGSSFIGMVAIAFKDATAGDTTTHISCNPATATFSGLHATITGGTPPGITLLQSNKTTVTGSGGFGSTLSCALGICTPGSVIVVTVTCEATAVSFVDDLANGTYNAPTGVGGVSHAFYVNNTSNAPQTVVVHFSSGAGTGAAISVYEIIADTGTPVYDTSDGISYVPSSPAYNNGHVAITTTAARCAGFACAVAYPSNYIVNPQSGWTNYVTEVVGLAHYHDSEYIIDLGGAGAKTAWAGQGIDSGSQFVGMQAIAFRPPTVADTTTHIVCNPATFAFSGFSATIPTDQIIDCDAGTLTFESYPGIITGNIQQPDIPTGDLNMNKVSPEFPTGLTGPLSYTVYEMDETGAMNAVTPSITVGVVNLPGSTKIGASVLVPINQTDGSFKGFIKWGIGGTYLWDDLYIPHDSKPQTGDAYAKAVDVKGDTTAIKQKTDIINESTRTGHILVDAKYLNSNPVVGGGNTPFDRGTG
jgi:hypothetical protein